MPDAKMGSWHLVELQVPRIPHRNFYSEVCMLLVVLMQQTLSIVTLPCRPSLQVLLLSPMPT